MEYVSNRIQTRILTQRNFITKSYDRKSFCRKKYVQLIFDTAQMDPHEATTFPNATNRVQSSNLMIQYGFAFNRMRHGFDRGPITLWPLVDNK